MQTTSNALPSGVPNVKLQYAYDAQSRRIGKTVYTNAAGSWVQASDSSFVYDGWNLMTEISNQVTQTATNHYAWGLDLSGSAQGAGGIGGLLFGSEVGGLMSNVCFYSYDGNGNVSALVDAATGNESARYEYGPFGEVIRASGAMAEANPFRFSTKYEDAETGLLYYGYRYYAPGTGRWLSRDPIGEEGGINTYRALANDSVAYIDGTGLYECKSEGKAAVDPFYGMYTIESESGHTTTCEASYSHHGVSIWPWTSAICNSGAYTYDDNSHLQIKARSPCCRKYRIQCSFWYVGKIGHNVASATGSSNPSAITLSAEILGHSYGWTKKAEKGSDGKWQATMTRARLESEIVQLGPEETTLFRSFPVVVAGNTEGPNGSGLWLRAWLDEVYGATCSLDDMGPCN